MAIDPLLLHADLCVIFKLSRANARPPVSQTFCGYMLLETCETSIEPDCYNTINKRIYRIKGLPGIQPIVPIRNIFDLS